MLHGQLYGGPICTFFLRIYGKLARSHSELLLSEIEEIHCGIMGLKQYDRQTLVAIVCYALGESPTERVSSLSRDLLLLQAKNHYKARKRPISTALGKKSGDATFGDDLLPEIWEGFVQVRRSG